MQHRWLRTSILVACFAAAASAGYWVSAAFGAEALRREAQHQLSTLMQGSVRIESARLVVRGGLFLEGERVGVYPRETVPPSPALFASRVSAEIDVLALLTGRFRLNGLMLDDATLEIRRTPRGEWSPPPFQWLVDRGPGPARDDMERSLDWVHAFEVATRKLLESPFIARRIEIRRSRITWYDESVQGRDGPVQVGLYQVEGRLVHHWLSGDADLELKAALVRAGERPVALMAEGWQRGGDEMRLAISAGQLPIAYIVPYLVGRDAGSRIEGSWSGELAYEAQTRGGHGIVSIQGALEDFSLKLSTETGMFDFERPVVQLQAALEIHPGRVRLAQGHFDAEGITVGIAGSIERPLDPAAHARLDIGVGGLDLEAVRTLVGALPDEDGETLEAVLARVDDGRIDRIGARGTARVDRWGALLVGEAERLPRGFVLSASVSDIEVRAGPTGRLSGMGGVVEVSGDRLRIRDATGLWNDSPLPRLAVSIHGVSHLFRSPEQIDATTSRAGALPGLGPLRALFFGGSDDEPARDASGAENASPHIRLEIERLEHPMLRWPVTDTRVAIDRSGPTTRLAFERGRWGGAPFEGDAVFMTGKREELVVSVRVQPPPPSSSGGGVASAPRAIARTGPWASGRFDIQDWPAGRWPLESVTGRFALTDTRLDLHDLHATLLPSGTLESDLSLELDDHEAVGLGVHFRIENGDVGRVGESVGLPPDYATGRLEVNGRLAGKLRPQTPLLTSLNGEVRLDARDGELRRDELPLVVALAQASAGYNDYASRDAIAYDSIGTSLHFRSGDMSTEDFELDGPLRIYASGTIDTVRPPFRIVGVVGLFLFRSAGQIMKTIPLVKAILPGSEKGLVGAYFEVSGPFDAPNVEALAGRSVEEDLPDVITAPYKLLRAVLGRASDREASAGEAEEEEDR